MKTNFKTYSRILLSFSVTIIFLSSCSTIRNNSTKLYLSFPVAVNKLVEDYQQYANSSNIDIYIVLRYCITDSCTKLYEGVVYKGYPQKKETYYDELITTNTFYHTRSKNIPVIIGNDIYLNFRHYLKYPQDFIATGSEYPFKIYFTEDSLVTYGFKWNMCNCKKGIFP